MILNQCQPQFEQFAAVAGCKESTVEETMACLRKASVSTLARAQDVVSGFGMTTYGSNEIVYVLPLSHRMNHITHVCRPYKLFTPVVDEKVITQNPTKSILEGKVHKVPLMVGYVFFRCERTPTMFTYYVQRHFQRDALGHLDSRRATERVLPSSYQSDSRRVREGLSCL